MPDNPYQPPTAPVGPPSPKRGRAPWLVWGLILVFLLLLLRFGFWVFLLPPALLVWVLGVGPLLAGFGAFFRLGAARYPRQAPFEVLEDVALSPDLAEALRGQETPWLSLGFRRVALLRSETPIGNPPSLQAMLAAPGGRGRPVPALRRPRQGALRPLGSGPGERLRGR